MPMRFRKNQNNISNQNPDRNFSEKERDSSFDFQNSNRAFTLNSQGKMW